MPTTILDSALNRLNYRPIIANFTLTHLVE
jgi:hypothetical protein